MEIGRGDLDDVHVLAEAAASADGVIHLAFKHDLAVSGDYVQAVQADLRTVTVLRRRARARPLVIASVPGAPSTADSGWRNRRTDVPPRRTGR